MANLKSRVLIVLFLIISIFPAYKLIKASAEDQEVITEEVIEKVDEASEQASADVFALDEESASGQQTASEPVTIEASADDKNVPEPETTLEEAKEESSDPVEVEKAIEEVVAEVKSDPKNSTLSNIAIIAKHVIKKTFTDKDELLLGNIASKILGSQNSAIEKELNKIILKKPIVKKMTKSKGFRIKAVVLINKHPLNAVIEVGKKDNKWYSVFYIKSPKNWKLSQYLPELLDVNKLIPGANKSELFEFGSSYFYISTMEMDTYKKFGKIFKGVGFSGKLKFAGAFETFDKMFDINGKYIKISGKIPANLVNSEFTIKTPKATIIPEILKVPGKPDVKLIPGFKVSLAQHEFYIKFVKKDIPELKATGGIIVTLPYEDKPIEFSSNIEFASKKLTLSGEQKTKMSKLFGLEGFAANACKVSIEYDFGSKSILPKNLKIEGELNSGKSKLKLEKFEVFTTAEKKINLVVKAKGSLYTKDFASFWLDAIIKDKNIKKEDILKLVPEVVLDDVSLDLNWTDSVADRSFKLKVNKADVKLGVAISGLIPGSGAQRSDVEDYLNKFSLKKAVIDYYKGGLRLRSNVSINNKLLKTSLEIAKNGDNKWYSLFYLESPEAWKLSELLPDTLDISKLFPKMNKEALAKLPKDVLEFKKSFFYISTIDIPEYQKSVMPKKIAAIAKEVSSSTEAGDASEIEETTEEAEKVAKEKITINIVKGVGFSGKAKFVGAFDFVDKIMGLDGKYFTVSGNITSKLIGSDFAIKIPTAKTIIPEVIKINGQDVKLIPGFKVDLMPQEFKIKFVKGIPEFSGAGGIRVTLPYEEKPLEFSSNMTFEDKSLKISGDQKTTISKLFGVDGLIIDGCHADISWDASSVNPVPKAINITGKLHSGKSNLELKLDFSLDDKKKVNLGLTSTGNLLVKDFAQFWLNVIVKDQKITNSVLPLMPDLKLEDVILTANWADKEEDRKLKLEVKKADIKLGEIVKVLIPSKDGQKSDIEKYLNKFSISKASAEYYKKGIKIESSTLINNNPLDLALEACKDDKKGWYALFYLKSPDKWKATDYLPDIFDVKKLFPGLDPSVLAQVKSADVFEFSESYFYVSTTDLKDYEKIGDIVQGAGFKGKAKFIGLLDVLDKLFVLNGKPLEISGDLKIPKLFGSKLAMKIPTNLTILPQSINVNGKKIDLIKGFQVDLAPFEFDIKVINDIPYVQLDSNGGVNVTTPFFKEKLNFFSKIKFSGKQMSLSGGQKNVLSDVFDVKGLSLHGCELGLNWDFGVSGKLAAQLAPATFGIGALAVLLPSGFIIEGGLSSQKLGSDKKCELNIKTDFSLNSTNSVDLKYESKGTLFARDFATFWLDVIVKTPNKQNDKKFKEDFMKNIPDWMFEDIYIKGAWAKDADKELILKAGKVEMIPGVQAKMDLKVSEAGVSGSGALLAPIFLPDAKDPVFQLSKSLTNKTEGPSFSVDCTINPVKVALKADAGLALKKLFPGFEPIESESKIDISEDGINLESKTKLLGFDSNLKIKGKLGTPIKIDDWEIIGGFEQKTTEEMSKLLKDTSKELLKANEDIKKAQTVATNNINNAKNKALKDIEASKAKANSDIDKFFKDSKNILAYSRGIIQNDLTAWINHYNKIQHHSWDWTWLVYAAERGSCWAIQIAPREIALAAVNITSIASALTGPIINAFARLGNQAISDAGKAFVNIGTDLGKGFTQLGTGVADIFTKAAADISKVINDFPSMFTIHSLKVEAKVADIKVGKLPLIEYDATVMGKRTDKPRKVQLDIKNPGEFIKAVAEIAIKDVTAIIAGKITEADKKASDEIEKQKKKTADEIKAAEDKAKALAGVK